MTGTLARYFGMRFLTTLIAVLAGVFALVVLIDYVEMMRRLADGPNASALKIAQTNASAQTRIYDLEADLHERELSRLN